jgi:lysozyme family protein
MSSAAASAGKNTDRRRFISGVAAVSGVAIAPTAIATAWAEEATLETAAKPWRTLNALVGRAQKLGLAAPRIAAGPVTASDEFDKVMPAIVDFINSVDKGPKARAASADVEAILEDATQLAIEVQRADHPPSAQTRSILPPGAAPPNFEKIREEYETAFAKCEIRAASRSEVNWNVKQILDNKARYQEVEETTCVPWFAIAVIHGMECSFNFRQHLHNGDSLKKKTWQVPAGRPTVWNPPTDWSSSAIDALRYDKMTGIEDWSLARTLYRWEAYNGWGSRAHGIKTPYLWSYSNQYSKGKYVADGKWDSDAVSKQCGAAVMLKVLVEKGEVGFV